MNRSNTIFKTLALLFLYFFFCGEANSFVLQKTSDNDYHRWAGTSISYQINVNGTPDDTGEFAAIQAAFQTWENVTSANISFTYNGTTNLAVVSPNLNNTIFWIENNWPSDLGPSVVARTEVWTSFLNNIVDADLFFNGEDYMWTTSGAPNRLDVQNIATHEIGHFIGITHTNDSGATMYANMALNETKKRSLEQDDIDAVSFLYPTAPVNIEIVSGNLQVGQPGAVLPEPLVVRVTDGIANPLAGQFVIFDIKSGSGALGNTSPIVTDLNGLAQTTLTLPGSVQTIEVRVVAAGLVEVNFTAEASQNSAPVIAGQNPLSTPEETAFIITLAQLNVTDPDNDYPDDFTLTVQDGSNYTRVGHTIAPVVDFNGELVVPVTVNDGAAESAVFNLSVQVTPVNDAPVAMDSTFTTMEDTMVSSTLVATDADGDALTFSLVSTGSLGTASLTDANTGAFIYSPNPNVTGTDTFTFMVNDGPLDSNEATVIVTINMFDTDEDAISDDDEINIYGTDPNNADTDADGLTDGEELDYWGADWSTDTDSDGINNLLDDDADNDGVLDGTEVEQGFDAADDTEAPATVYEDAEDGTTAGWSVYDDDPIGAVISNVYDADCDSRVIELVGDGTYNGYRRFSDDGSPWQNIGQFVVSWKLKYSEFFIVYLDVQTTAGHRYFQYEPVDGNSLGNGRYVHHGLGSAIMDGQWHTVNRDLQADLEEAQPGERILEVNSFLIRGSGRVDDILLKLTEPWDTDGDGITDFAEENNYATDPNQTDSDQDGISDGDEINIYGTDAAWADTDADGLPDGEELNYWGADWNADFDSDGINNLLDDDADNDGVLDVTEIEQGFDAADNTEAPATVYEDAEDGTTAGWSVYDDDPIGAVIINVYDADIDSRVIELSGDGTHNGYRRFSDDGSPWRNTGQFVVSWKLKYSEFFIVYLDVKTTAGYRYLQYEPVDKDKLGNRRYVHHGLGSAIMDGQWHTVHRDLQADLETVQPGVSILEVNSFLIRGSGRVDDILLKLTEPWDTDVDSITDFVEVNIYATDPNQTDSDQDGISDGDEINIYGTDPARDDTDADGLPDGEELDYWGADWNADFDSDGINNLLDDDADNDGVLDGTEVEQGFDAADNTEAPATVYEDAEDGTTAGWSVYDEDPAGAVISNVYDADIDSRVIELSGDGPDNGYQLLSDDGSSWQNIGQFVVSWKLKYSEFFIVYLDVQTTAGHRYLQYEPVDKDKLGNRRYVHHGLGSAIMDGQWHTVNRDLQADLEEAQPGVSILEVNSFLIRGSGRVDDIVLTP